MQKKILEERPFKENENILKNNKNCTLQMEKKGKNGRFVQSKLD